MAIIARDQDLKKLTYRKLEIAVQVTGPEINIEKAKFMLFKYLVTQQNSMPVETVEHTVPEHRTYFVLFNVFKSRLLAKPKKIWMYKTIFRSFIAYGTRM